MWKSYVRERKGVVWMEGESASSMAEEWEVGQYWLEVPE